MDIFGSSDVSKNKKKLMMSQFHIYVYTTIIENCIVIFFVVAFWGVKIQITNGWTWRLSIFRQICGLRG